MTGLIDGRPINRGDLAALCGVSLPTVDRGVEKGCPSIERGSRGVEWRFDSAAVIDWRIQRAVENAVMNAGDDSSKARREDADCRRAVANAVLAEMLRPVRKGHKQDSNTFFQLSNGVLVRVPDAASNDAFRRYSAHFQVGDPDGDLPVIVFYGTIRHRAVLSPQPTS